MRMVNSSSKIDELRFRLNLLGNLIVETQNALPFPLRVIGKNKIRSFRFGNPDIRHYLILHIAKSVSHLNAIIDLYEIGYLFESAALVRMYIDAVAQFDYVLAGVRMLTIDDKSKIYLKKYFADVEDGETTRPKKIDLTKKSIHRRLSEAMSIAISDLETFKVGAGTNNEKNEYEDILYTLYAQFSCYVHGRYLESMNLFEYETGVFKCNGGIEAAYDEGYESMFDSFTHDVEIKYGVMCFKLFPLYPSLFSNRSLEYACNIAGIDRPSFFKNTARGN